MATHVVTGNWTEKGQREEVDTADRWDAPAPAQPVIEREATSSILFRGMSYPLADGAQFTDCEGNVWEVIPGTVVTTGPDPVAVFNERRRLKREAVAPSVHPWAAAGHTHADWSTDACPKCLLTGQEVLDRDYYPKCDDYKREREDGQIFARAMSAPAPLDGDFNQRLMPWRGKQ